MSCRPRRAAALAFPCLAVIAASAAAQSDQVVVTATRSPVAVSDALAEVSVIERATIETSEARTLVELLAQTPGVQFTNNGGLGRPSSLFVRGLEARHVLLLVDGVRVGSATLGTPSFDNLPLESIERIELVRGPMSSVYGSGAMGGVVQVFTRRGGSGLRGNVKASYGSDNYGLATAGVGFGDGGFGAAVQVQRQQTDGFSATNPDVPFGSYNPDDDGFTQNAGSVRLDWAFAPGWSAEALYLDSNGTTQFDDGLGANARAGLRNTLLALQVGGRPVEGWTTQLQLGQSSDAYRTIASASPWATLGTIETEIDQIVWENRIGLPLGEALVVVERFVERVSAPDPYDVERRELNALGLGWTLQRGPHNAQVSLRRDLSSQFGGENTGAAAYSYAFTPAWRAGGAYGTTFNAPSFNQLYYPGFGNPDLQPERGRHGELFVQWSDAVQQVRLTAYRQRYESYISSGPQAVNVPRVGIDGATLAWDARLDAFTLSASYDYLNPRIETAGSPDNGNLLPRRAQRAGKAAVAWTHGPVDLGATLQAYSQRYDDFANKVKLAGYAVLDLYADWRVARDVTVGVRVNNVTDQSYETAFGYNQPGRSAFVVLRWAPRAAP
jgi:vitamin B12 transporter